MLTLIIGGGASGKSPLAERLVVATGLSPRLYIATMRPWDGECRARIARHRHVRRGKGFDTLECYEQLERADVAGYRIVLLECLGNLLLNDPDPAGILRGVRRLVNVCGELVVVSNDVFSDGGGYGEYTDAYVRQLALLHREIAKDADRVVEMAYGTPIRHKGVLPPC